MTRAVKCHRRFFPSFNLDFSEKKILLIPSRYRRPVAGGAPWRLNEAAPAALTFSEKCLLLAEQLAEWLTPQSRLVLVVVEFAGVSLVPLLLPPPFSLGADTLAVATSYLLGVK